MKAKKTIYVVDDEAIVRASTMSLLRARGDLDTQEFVSGGALLDALDDLAPGCVILDLQMEGESGAAVMSALAERKRDFRTIVVTGAGDINTAVGAFRAGAVDFLYKPYEIKPLMEALDRALHLLEHGIEPPHAVAQAQAAITRLSPAEASLLQSLIDGRTNQEIARIGGTDERSVQMLRARLLTTLEAPSLLAAIRTAMIAGNSAEFGAK